MRILYTTFACLLWLTSSAQTFEVDTVLKNGPLAERINLVFLGDGYTASEQGVFIQSVNGILEELFSQAPFNRYKNYFNAFAVKVISLESGVSHPRTSPDPDCAAVPQMTVNNYFGSRFDNSNIHRLLYPTNLPAIVGVLGENFPLYDLAFIAVNTPYYGGAGGYVATFSNNTAGRDVAIHELGHTLGGLADEYWAGAGYAREMPNMTKQANQTMIKWKNWLGVNGVGIYGHTGDLTWKKPHQNCKMGVLGVPLCKVCSEAFVERFHEFVRAVNGHSPADENILVGLEADHDMEFSISLIKPDPNTLKVTWTKDDVVIGKNVESVTVSAADIVIKSTIRATVIDTSNLTRSEAHLTSHLYVTEWDVFKGDAITGVEIQTKARQYNLSVFPNPSASDLKFEYTLSKPSPVSVTLMDTNGRQVKNLIDTQQEAGEYSYKGTKAELRVPPGTYVLQFTFGKTIIPMKVILQ